jgi:hypothetical protein
LPNARPVAIVIDSAADGKTLSASVYSHAELKSVMNSDVSRRNQGKMALPGIIFLHLC